MKKNLLSPAILVSYSKRWPLVAAKEIKKISKALAVKNACFEHIGSTAILGTLAKPEIDLMIGVKNLREANRCIPTLETLGYVYFPKFENIVPERRYLRKSDGLKPLLHIHVVRLGSGFWRDHLLFRDYLRNNLESVHRYNSLKKGLVRKFKDDRASYSKGKTKFVLDILKRAQLDLFHLVN